MTLQRKLVDGGKRKNRVWGCCAIVLLLWSVRYSIHTATRRPTVRATKATIIRKNETRNNVCISRCPSGCPESKLSASLNQQQRDNSTAAADDADALIAQPFKGMNWNTMDGFLVIPEYKLLFCTVEKVGCTMFQQLFRLLRMYHPSLSVEERTFVAQKMYSRFTPEHFNLKAEDYSSMLRDDSWTKAVFFRDPATRFLSAFKSKCRSVQRGGDRVGSQFCRRSFGKKPGGVPNLMDGNETKNFQEAIRMAETDPEQVFSDRHWLPTTHFCGGLKQTLKYYDFVHVMDRTTVGENTGRLLRHILPVASDNNSTKEPDLAKRLIENVVRTGGRYVADDVNRIKELYNVTIRIWGPEPQHDTSGPSAVGPSNQAYFSSPNMLHRLQSAYKADYDLFRLEPITFDEL